MVYAKTEGGSTTIALVDLPGRVLDAIAGDPAVVVDGAALIDHFEPA
jgi:hypothetical protein